MDIQSNITAIKKVIGKDVILVAVTKKQPSDKINIVIDAGIKIIGENRVQDALKKFPDLKPVEKHFIGRLQTNKIKKIVEHFDLIQSVDQAKYLIKINKHAAEAKKIMPVLIEVNISGDAEKGGIHPDEICDLLASTIHLKNVRIVGLMGMAKETDDEQELREEFSNLKNLFERIKEWNLPHVEMKHLSMGMTNDYAIAVEEGSGMVRVGRGIFEF